MGGLVPEACENRGMNGVYSVLPTPFSPDGSFELTKPPPRH